MNGGINQRGLPMMNRAKCKLCQSIVISELPNEIVYCKCGEIAVCDGAAMRMWPVGSPHFVRVDDLGNEIVVSYKKEAAKSEEDKNHDHPKEAISKGELIKSFEDALSYTENSPEHEQFSFVTNISLCHHLRALVNILKRE